MESIKLTIKEDLSVEVYNFDKEMYTESNLIECIERYYKADQHFFSCFKFMGFFNLVFFNLVSFNLVSFNLVLVSFNLVLVSFDLFLLI